MSSSFVSYPFIPVLFDQSRWRQIQILDRSKPGGVRHGFAKHHGQICETAHYGFDAMQESQYLGLVNNVRGLLVIQLFYPSYAIRMDTLIPF